MYFPDLNHFFKGFQQPQSPSNPLRVDGLQLTVEKRLWIHGYPIQYHLFFH